MMFRKLTLCAVAVLTLISLASCTSKPGKVEISLGSGITYDDAIKASLEMEKNDMQKDGDKLTYSVKWSSGWDKNWKRDYCDEFEKSEKKLDTILKEHKTELYTCTIKKSGRIDDEKFEILEMYFVGVSSESQVSDRLFIAGYRTDKDGDITEGYGSGDFDDYIYGFVPSDPFSAFEND